MLYHFLLLTALIAGRGSMPVDTGALIGSIDVYPPYMVQAVLQDSDGHPLGEKSVDAIGKFEWNELAPGEYFLAFNGRYIVGGRTDTITVLPGKSTEVSYSLTCTVEALAAWLYATAVMNPQGFGQAIGQQKNRLASGEAQSILNRAARQIRKKILSEFRATEQFRDRIAAGAASVGLGTVDAARWSRESTKEFTEMATMESWFDQVSEATSGVLAGDVNALEKVGSYPLWVQARSALLTSGLPGEPTLLELTAVVHNCTPEQLMESLFFVAFESAHGFLTQVKAD